MAEKYVLVQITLHLPQITLWIVKEACTNYFSVLFPFGNKLFCLFDLLFITLHLPVQFLGLILQRFCSDVSEFTKEEERRYQMKK